MKTFFLLTLVIMSFYFSQNSISVTFKEVYITNEIWVSPDGDDEIGDATQEKPYATVTKAKAAARKISGNVTVILRGGIYFEGATLEFTPEDNNVLYKAYSNEKPLISGGYEISGPWIDDDSGIIYTDLGLTIPLSDENYFKRLYVGNEERQRARNPNFDRENNLQFLWKDGTVFREGKNAFKYLGNVVGTFDNLNDVMIHLYQKWLVTQHWIAQVDETESICRFFPTTWFNPETDPWMINPFGPYYIENAKVALDLEGEWYLDRATGRLYFNPHASESAENLVVIAPRVSKLIRFSGTPDSKVENIRFEGVSFMHTDWNVAVTSHTESQAHDRIRDAMIWAEYAEDISFYACEKTCGGSHGIAFDVGCRNDTVQKCHIHNLGGGGVYVGQLGEWNPANLSSDLPEYIVLDNNFITDLSHFFEGSCGIWIGNANYCTVSHNDISDTDQAGINVGHVWNSNEPSYNHHNIIEYNHVYNIGRGEVSDFGIIYTLGYSPGTVIRNNVLHHLKTYEGLGHGIYLDDGSKGITVERNLVYKTDGSSFFLKDGDNDVHDNIFAYPEAGTIRTWDEHPGNGTFKSNIMLYHLAQFNEADLIEATFDVGTVVVDSNIFWDINNPSGIKFDDQTLSEWQAKGYDINSLVIFPEFIDSVPKAPADFILKPGSPAFDLGFDDDIDWEKAGLYGEPGWTGMPDNYTPRYKSIYDEMGPTGDGKAPAKPTSLTVVSEGRISVDLTWTDASDNEQSFTIKRKSGAGNYSIVGTVGENVAAFNDRKVHGDEEYTYTVVSYNTNGSSDDAPAVTANTLPPSAGPIAFYPFDGNPMMNRAMGFTEMR